MPKIPEIKFEDIVITEKYLEGYEKERCNTRIETVQ